jgi:hypothetical protein
MSSPDSTIATRIRRRPLLREVNHGIGPVLADQVEQLLEVLRDVEPVKSDLTAGELAPGGQARPERRDRRQRGRLELDVGVSPGEVVDDQDVVTALGQMQRRWPAAKAVAAENHHARGAHHFRN